MLLTGFDAPRLKRLYFGRKIKDHGLLQAITPVNRPYKDLRYGYLIDFADIKENFEKTNEAYLRELNSFNQTSLFDEGEDAPDMYKQVIADKEELLTSVKQARQVLFEYPTKNAEEFSKVISAENNRGHLIDLRRALTLAKEAFNLVNTFGDEELKADFKKLEIKKLPQMISEVNNRITLINQKENFEHSHDYSVLINQTMNELEFSFVCVGKEELEIIDQGTELKEQHRKGGTGLRKNFDHEDPEFVKLSEEFFEMFEKKGIEFRTIEEYKALLEKSKIFNEKRKANNEQPIISEFDEDIQKSLLDIKILLDSEIENRSDLLNQEALLKKTVKNLVTKDFSAKDLYKSRGISDIMTDSDFVVTKIVNQYNQFYN